MERILVVDDESNIRAIVRTRLEQVGYVVDEAPEGTEAWRKLQAERFDLVITDVFMPGVSGEELIQLMETDSVTARVPVLLLCFKSANRSQEEYCHYVASLRRQGKFSYLVKPFDPNRLVLDVQTLLDQLTGEQLLNIFVL